MRNYSVPSRPHAVDAAAAPRDDDEEPTPVGADATNAATEVARADEVVEQVGEHATNAATEVARADEVVEQVATEADAAVAVTPTASGSMSVADAVKRAVDGGKAAQADDAEAPAEADPGVRAVLVTPVTTKVTRGVAKIVHTEASVAGEQADGPALAGGDARDVGVESASEVQAEDAGAASVKAEAVIAARREKRADAASARRAEAARRARQIEATKAAAAARAEAARSAALEKAAAARAEAARAEAARRSAAAREKIEAARRREGSGAKDGRVEARQSEASGVRDAARAESGGDPSSESSGLRRSILLPPHSNAPVPVFRPPGSPRYTPTSMPAIQEPVVQALGDDEDDVAEREDPEVTREVFAEMVTLSEISRSRPPPPPPPKQAAPAATGAASVLSSLAIEDEEDELDQVVYVRATSSRSAPMPAAEDDAVLLIKGPLPAVSEAVAPAAEAVRADAPAAEANQGDAPVADGLAAGAAGAADVAATEREAPATEVVRSEVVAAEDESTRSIRVTDEAHAQPRAAVEDETPTLLFAPSSAEILLPVPEKSAVESSANAADEPGAEPPTVAAEDVAADEEVAAEQAGSKEARLVEVGEATPIEALDAKLLESSEVTPIASIDEKTAMPAVYVPTEGAVDEADDPLIGLMIDDRYRLERVIGSGGMSRVYQAAHVRSGGKVAIKIIELHLSHRPETMRRCEQEARAMMEIQSNHVVRAHDVGTFPTGQLYVVMELLAGETLEHVIKREGPLPWERVASMALQICSGLTAGHKRGIFHRDIKPQNCMRVDLDDNVDHVKLIDFGLARDVNSSDSGVTQEGVILGTPEYMAPELIASRATPDARSDVYAVGATMYKLLTGSAVFHEKNALDTLFQHKHTAPRPPSQAAPEQDIPASIDEIVMRSLAKDPAQRFATAEEMAQRLRVALGRPISEASGRHSAKSMRERSAPIVVAGVVNSDTIPPAMVAASTRPVTGPSVVVQRRLLPTTPAAPSASASAVVVAPVIEESFLWARMTAVLVAIAVLVTLVLVVWPPGGTPEAPQEVAKVQSSAPPVRSPKIPPRELKAPPTPVTPVADTVAEMDPAEPPTDAGAEVVAKVEAPKKSNGDDEFNFRSARSLIAEQHDYLRETCMKKGKEPTRVLKFHVAVRPNGRTQIFVDGDQAVRACVRTVLGFGFPPSPNGGSFDYTLWLADSRMDRRTH